MRFNTLKTKFRIFSNPITKSGPHPVFSFSIRAITIYSVFKEINLKVVFNNEFSILHPPSPLLHPQNHVKTVITLTAYISLMSAETIYFSPNSRKLLLPGILTQPVNNLCAPCNIFCYIWTNIIFVKSQLFNFFFAHPQL